MQRVGFVLKVKPARMDDYVRAHRHVWPEMLSALKDAGVRDYSIFRDGDTVFGTFATDDVARTEEYLAGLDVSARWQDSMATFLEDRVPDAGPPSLEEIFRLD